MKKKPILLLSFAATIFAAFGFASCGVNEGAIMKQKDAISICYDCNGGAFAEAEGVTFYDVIPLKNIPADGNEKNVALVAPGDDARGQKGAAASNPSKTGYFLAGWYQQRIPRVDENGNPLDENGVLTSVSGKEQGYSFADKWDFETDRITLDTSKSYTAETEILTLYAAWIPNFSYEFMAPESYEEDGVTVKEWKNVGTTNFNPLVQKNTLKMPTVNESTGGYQNNDIPTITGKTFDKAYVSEDLTEEWTEITTHGGSIDKATGTAIQPVQKVYTTWKEGTWYKISNVQQFITSANAVGYYELEDNLDFNEKYWPSTLSMSVFNGAIYGNGHTISNVNLEQVGFDDMYGGLFGGLSEKAVIENITFTNVTYTLRVGSRIPNAKFGLLAGENNSSKLTNVSISGKLLISDEIYDNQKNSVPYANYSIGLLFGVDMAESANAVTQSITHEVFVATQNDEGTKLPQITATLNDGDGSITLARASA